jgi:predicted nicotinamide N-methyase
MAPRTEEERAAFVREQTTLTAVPLAPELSVYTATAVTPLWFATAQWLEDHQSDVPFWSVPWAGGQALARYLLDHPEAVAGKRVLDFACGSGLVGVAALRAGASRVRAVDVDLLAATATRLNAGANGVSLAALEIVTADLVGGDLDDVDVLLAGDVWYERDASARFRDWFRALAAAGIRVLTGDPGRLHVPRRARELARYQVPTPFELESVGERTARVLEM